MSLKHCSYFFIVLMFAAGCNSSSESFYMLPPNGGGTTGKIEHITKGVVKFTDGVANLSEDTNTGAYVVAYSVPAVKSESWNDEPSTSNATVVTSGSGKSVIAEAERNAYMPEDTEWRLFSPEERRRLVKEAEQRPLMVKALETVRNVFKIGDVWSGINVEYRASKIVDAKCIEISDVAFFMQETNTPDIDKELLAGIVKAFSKSHGVIRENFGKENDIDGNGKVIVLFFNMDDSGILGYFYPVDKTEIQGSNRADIFYINLKAVTQERENLVNFTLAHEMQHMVFYDTKKVTDEAYDAATWLDEGLAMLSPYLAGLYVDGADRHTERFLSNYNKLSLTNWTDNNYGFSMMFTVYLHERFGAAAIKAIYGQDVTGWRVVERVTGMDFNKLFGEFAVALAISGRGYSDETKYNIKGVTFSKYENSNDVNLVPLGTLPAGATYSDKIQPYSLSLRDVTGATSRADLSGVSDGFVFIKK